MKNVFFWTEVAVYLKHGMRQVHSYYGLLMESHRWYRIDPCYLRWNAGRDGPNLLGRCL